MIEVFEFSLRRMATRDRRLYDFDDSFMRKEIISVARELSGMHLQVMFYAAMFLIAIFCSSRNE